MWRPRKPVSRPRFELRDFAEFMVYEGGDLPCCLTASEDDLEEDPGAYTNCEACPVADKVDGLCASNREVWRLYRQIVTRFTVDTHTTHVALQKVTESLSQDDTLDLVERFSILYGVFNPPPKGSE